MTVSGGCGAGEAAGAWDARGRRWRRLRHGHAVGAWPAGHTPPGPDRLPVIAGPRAAGLLAARGCGQAGLVPRAVPTAQFRHRVAAGTGSSTVHGLDLTSGWDAAHDEFA